MKYTLFPILILLTIVIWLPARSFAFDSEADRTILVDYKNDSDSAKIESTVKPKSVDDRVLDDIGVTKLEFNSKSDRDTALAKLSKNPEVKSVEKESTVSVLQTPSDPSYGSQSYLTQIKAPAGWDYSTGSNSVVVAIVDTGIDGTHPELTGRVGSGYNFVNSTAIGVGADSDDHGHGTNMSGVIAATANNGVGIAGLNWSVSLMPVKAIASNGTGLVSDIASGITWAVDHGAKVVNMSFGGVNDSTTLKSAVEYASGKGAILLGASGNDGAGSILYPSAYGNVISVGAVDSNDTKASFSNYGSPLDVVAPGVSILTTNDGGDYGTVSGTSISTALVSGEAGLLWAKHPSATSDKIKELIEKTDTVSGMNGQSRTDSYGYGRINLQSALSSYYEYSSTYVSQSGVVSRMPGNSASMSVTFKNNGRTTWAARGANPVILAVHYRKDMEAFNKRFYNSSWVSADRIAWLPNNVDPGQSVTIPFTITVPSDLSFGEYQFYVQLVAENATWLPEHGGGAWWTIKTNDIKSSYVSQSKWIQGDRGSTHSMSVAFNNNGSIGWTARGTHPVILAVHYRKDMEAFNKRFRSSDWLSADRIAWLPNDVDPGQSVSIPFTVTIPSDLASGTYQFYVQLVAEGFTWLPDQGGGAWWTIIVN